MYSYLGKTSTILITRRSTTDIITGIAFVALEAVLRTAGPAWVIGAGLQSVGVALMVIGAAGLVVSFILWSSWGSSWVRERAGRGRQDAAVIRGRRFGARRGERHDDIDKAA